MSTYNLFILSLLSAVALGAPLSTTQHLSLLQGNFTMPPNATIAATEATLKAVIEDSPQNPDFSTDALIGIILGGTVGLVLILWGMHRLAQRMK